MYRNHTLLWSYKWLFRGSRIISIRTNWANLAVTIGVSRRTTHALGIIVKMLYRLIRSNTRFAFVRWHGWGALWGYGHKMEPFERSLRNGPTTWSKWLYQTTINSPIISPVYSSLAKRNSLQHKSEKPKLWNWTTKLPLTAFGWSRLHNILGFKKTFNIVYSVQQPSSKKPIKTARIHLANNIEFESVYQKQGIQLPITRLIIGWVRLQRPICPKKLKCTEWAGQNCCCMSLISTPF